MKYSIIDIITKNEPEYVSFFPTRRKNRGKDILGHVCSASYRWEIALYIDDVEAYEIMDGCQEKDVYIPSISNLSYFPGWIHLSHIPTYSMPRMQIESHSSVDRTFSSNLILDKKIDGDQLIVRTVKLVPANSTEGLSKVSSSYFEYSNSWIEDFSPQKARMHFSEIKEKLETGYSENKKAPLEWFNSFVISVLKPSMNDCGLVQEAKMKDYCLLSKLWSGITNPSPLRGTTYDSLIANPDYSATWPLASEMYESGRCPKEFYDFNGYLRKKYDNEFFLSLVNYAKSLMTVSDKDFAKKDIRRIKSIWRSSGIQAPPPVYQDFLTVCNSIEER